MTGSRLRTAAGAVFAVVLATAVAMPLVGAGEIRISMDAGRVTLIATDAPLADILDEWSRTGETRFLGAEAIGGELITLHLVDTVEAEALRLLLRSAAGYVAAPRRAGASGLSRYDRVTVLATRGTSAPAPIRSASPIPGNGGGSAALPANDPIGAATEPPALVSMEELQRLLDAAAADRAISPSEAASAPPTAPVVATPFPGIGADPGSSPLPDRWRRAPRRP